jgi:hypothetical protein
MGLARELASDLDKGEFFLQTGQEVKRLLVNCFRAAVKHPVKVCGQPSAPRKTRKPVVAKRAR